MRWIENTLRDAVYDILGGIMGNFNEQLGTAVEQVAQSPVDFALGGTNIGADIMNMLQNLSDNVILPLAGLVFTVLVTYELIGLIMQKNNLGDVDLGMFLKWGIRVVFGIFFLSYAFPIVNGIFSIGSSVISSAVGGGGGLGSQGNNLISLLTWIVNAIGLLIMVYGVIAFFIGFTQDDASAKHRAALALVGGAMVIGAGLLISQVGQMWGSNGGGDVTVGGEELTLDVELLREAVDDMGTGELVSMFLMTLVIRGVMWVASIGIQFIIIQRFIEIYMYASLAALPMSTFVNSEMGSVGKNYIKTMAAYTFQGLLLIIVFSIYDVLVSSALNGMMAEVVQGEDIMFSMVMLAGFSILLLKALWKTGAVAKTIFGVS
ncbi:MAG: CD0415/CD1112 family protein [Defluviitaleaceae bacterium]|nr:CD0415/CD1112 family protein [Defluviitaleaceae bacterium]